MDEAQKQAMAEAVARIRENMTTAAKAAGRDPGEVLLCAACKTRTVEEVRYSADLPIDLFGENHVQELVEKTDAGAYNGKPGHFIGHLQTNKVNKVVGRAALIQSVDSTRLLDKIEAAAERLGITQEILMEINIGAEESKSGVGPDDLWPLLDAAAAKTHIKVRGLMAIPPADADDTATRRFFAEMRELLAKAAARGYENARMNILSMGMSHDYAAAIAEASLRMPSSRSATARRAASTARSSAPSWTASSPPLRAAWLTTPCRTALPALCRSPPAPWSRPKA